MQRSDKAAEEVGPDHLQNEPGGLEAVDSGGGNCEHLVLRVEVAPVAVTDHLRLSGGAKWMRLLLHNPAPPVPPFVPLLLVGPVWVRLLAQGPRDPGDVARESPS